MTKTPNIYHYRNSRQFLLDSLAERQKQDPEFSVRSLARSMGLPSHSLLLMLLQGKRPLRVKHVSFLSRGFALSADERLYLQALIQFESAESPEEKELCRLWLSEVYPSHETDVREVNDLKIVSHWVHTAILTMTELPDFRGEEQEIVERLRGKVSIHEVRAALERLQSAGLACRDESGRLRATQQRITSANDVINVGVRNHHKLVAELAKIAVDTQPVESREFQAFSVPMNRRKMALAKDMIRKFRSQLANAMKDMDEGESADEVYQMNIQLFQLTESPSRMVREEDEGVETDSNEPVKEECV